jgi:hypothetical protein
MSGRKNNNQPKLIKKAIAKAMQQKPKKKRPASGGS